MTYVLKTRSPSGQLVRPSGITAEYDELHAALRDAEVFREVLGEEIVVVRNQQECIVAFV